MVRPKSMLEERVIDNLSDNPVAVDASTGEITPVITSNAPKQFVPLTFDEAYRLDTRQYIEQKDNLSYLSWSHAVRLLKTHIDPNAYWKFEPAEFFGDGSAMVKVHLFVNGIAYEQCLSVMHRGRIVTANGKSFTGITANPAPNSKDISDCQQRCLVKAIATSTGIGLTLYSGEILEFQDARGISEEDIEKSYAMCATVEAIGNMLKRLLISFSDQKEALVAAATKRKLELQPIAAAPQDA